MDAKSSPLDAAERPFPRGLLGSLDASVAADVVAAGGDVAFVIDRNGIICDMALSNEAMARDGVAGWLDRRWSDTVAVDSRHKVDEMLRDALNGGKPRWREVNQITSNSNPLMIRYVAVDAGHEGRVIAIGRDERAAMAMQQRLMEAQQAMERDYARLRDAEFRYRLLFQTAGEAVLVVDAASKRIVEANPAADRFVGAAKQALVGELFVKIFEDVSQEGAAALLTVVQAGSRSNSAQSRLTSQGREFSVSASLFRHERTSQFLVRLSPVDDAAQAIVDPDAHLHTLLERMPDGFIVTDSALKIVTANAAFLDMVRVGTREQVDGQSLTRFLGRAGLDRNILLDNLRAHGVVRNFSTLLRTQYDEQEDVEVSAVTAPDGEDVCYGFSIRSAGRRLAERGQNAPELRRSVEHLATLVGRVTLKDLVRETTDLVERLCIEAALELTKNNRASAAEILGLSRQSLYSKLHRFGLGNLADVEN